jgi:cathepsin A (carboxypeptidase C)
MIGFIQEHGPCAFLEDSDHSPSENPYSWNKFANVVYLESPAGVGFNHFSGKFHYDDENVSYENLKAVQQFFDAFPEFRSNDLYLSGESYGGIYIPYLALRIDEFNQNAANDEQINLKGFAIGNGVTNWKYDTTPAFVQMGFTHGLISLDLYNRINDAGCDFAEMGAPPLSNDCHRLLHEFNEAVAHVYPYDIYRPPEDYYQVTPQKSVSDLLRLESDSDTSVPYASFSRLVRNNVKKSSNDFSAVNKFMNDDATKTALNVPTDYFWSECSNIDYSMLEKATQWIYPKLKGKYRMMHYSGTTDGVVPTVGTEQWMADLGWTVTEPRSAWMSEPKLLGGYTQKREGNLDFISIHGCGHMAPQWKRNPAFVAISSWILEKELPRP